VLGDKTQLRQVVLNLVANARKAIPDGGVIRVEAANVHIDEHEFRGKPNARPGDFVRIRVIDTGHGIPLKDRHQIFKPFFTTKRTSQHALGLGLAMSYGIIERHSGWIEFTSEENRGTTFTFFLRREQAPPPKPEQPAALQGTETILIVEDEDTVRKLGSSILTRYGYRVMTAVDGQEALEVYLKHRREIDLIILDLSMPRLSGRDTYRRLRQLSATVPIVFTSGQVDELYAQAQADPAQGCISKPYRPEELAALVRRVLDRQREGAEAS
jgi:CheY-like chemotaxis protein